MNLKSKIAAVVLAATTIAPAVAVVGEQAAGAATTCHTFTVRMYANQNGTGKDMAQYTNSVNWCYNGTSITTVNQYAIGERLTWEVKAPGYSFPNAYNRKTNLTGGQIKYEAQGDLRFCVLSSLIGSTCVNYWRPTIFVIVKPNGSAAYGMTNSNRETLFPTYATFKAWFS